MSGPVAPAKLLAGFAIPFTSAVIGRPFMNTGNSKAYLGLYQLFRSVLARFAHFLCHRSSRDVFFLFPRLHEQGVCQELLATFFRVSLSPSIQRRTGFSRLRSPEPFGRLSFAGPLEKCTKPKFKSNPPQTTPISPDRTLSSPICFSEISSSIASAREFLPPPSSRCLRD